ncbi:MAG: hypothetical protein ABI321_00555 [Polyangia bacterium]
MKIPERRVAQLAVLAALVGFAIYWVREVRLVGDFDFDDTFITLRYARNLAVHGHLSFNLDDRVDGFTSPGWTLFLALLLKLGFNGPRVAVLASNLFGLLGGWMAVLLARRLGASFALALCACAMTLSSGDWITWAAPGMETPFAAVCAVLLLLSLAVHRLPNAARAGACVLAYLARPECVILVAVALLHDALVVLRSHGDERRRAAGWFGLTVLLISTLFFGHWLYYGYPLPNTYYAKLSGVRFFKRGVPDLEEFAKARYIGAVLLAAPVVAILGGPRRRAATFAFMPWLLASCWTYAAAGGDYLEGHRFYQPLVPAAWAFIAAGLGLVLVKLPGQRIVQMVVGIACAALAIVEMQGLHDVSKGLLDSGKVIVSVKSYARQWRGAGRAFARCYPPSTSMSVRPAGVIPWETDFRTFDTLGLNTREVAMHPGITRDYDPGHTKEASAAQVVAWMPDLVLNHPHFAATDETGPLVPRTPVEYVRAGYLTRCIPDGRRWVCALERPGLLPPDCH